MKKVIFLFAALVFVVPSLLAEEVKPEAKKEIKTKFSTVAVGDTRDKLYKAFPESERLYIPHKILDEEWVVFRNINSDNPHDAITFYLKNGIIESWKESFNPAPKNEGSPYEFHKDEKMDKWFFPAGESKWDGSKLTAIEWNMLTDSQKVMFLTEYANELKKELGRDISIDIAKYMVAMDYYADTCPTSCFTKPATNVVRELLGQEGQIKKEGSDVGGSQGAAPPS